MELLASTCETLIQVNDNTDEINETSETIETGEFREIQEVMCAYHLTPCQGESDKVPSPLTDPHLYAVQRGGASVWVHLTQEAKGLLRGDVLTATMTFLLALGFDAPDKEAVTLVVEAFEPVDAAAEENRLINANWRLLSSQAPSVLWDGDWDKCGRLRRVVLRKLL